MIEKNQNTTLRQVGLQYAEQINANSCNAIEKIMLEEYIEGAKEPENSFPSHVKLNNFFDDLRFDTADSLIKQGLHIPALLKDETEGIALYLRHLTDCSFSQGLYRIDVREGDYGAYRGMFTEILFAFFIFKAQKMEMETLILGGYRAFTDRCTVSFAPLIAVALMREEPKAIEAVKRVLFSENNVGILTNDVIRAIQESENEELHNLLLDLLRAARLQEGLRQSIAERGNEYSLGFYRRLIEVVAEENFLRYSSIKRSVQTWCGLGYESVDDKDIPKLFEGIRRYINSEEARREAYAGDNALEVYLALYCKGAISITFAIEKARELINSAPIQIAVAAIYYLRRCGYFSVWEHLELVRANPENKFLLAFVCSQLSKAQPNESGNENIRYPDTALVAEVYNLLEKFTKGVKANSLFPFGGFEWFSVRLEKSDSYDALYSLLLRLLDRQELIDRFLSMKIPANSIILRATWYWQAKKTEEVERFCSKVLPAASRAARVNFLVQHTPGMEERSVAHFAPALAKEQLTEKELVLLEKKLSSKLSKTRQQVVQLILQQPVEMQRNAYERLSTSNDTNARDAAAEMLRESAALAALYGGTTGTEAETEQIERAEIGYGLYTPSTDHAFGYYPRLKQVKIGRKGVMGLLKGKQEALDTSLIFRLSEKRVIEIFEAFDRLIDAHAKDEYKARWHDEGDMTQLGDRYFYYVNDNHENDPVGGLPFPALWRSFITEQGIEEQDLFGLYICRLYCGGCTVERLTEPVTIFPFGDKIDAYRPRYCNHLNMVFEAFFKETERKNPRLIFEQAMLYIELMWQYTKGSFYTEKNWNGQETKHSILCLAHWNRPLALCHNLWESEEEFKRAAALLGCVYTFYTKQSPRDIMSKWSLPPLMAAKMRLMGMFPSDDFLYELLLDSYQDKSDSYSSDKTWINLDTASQALYHRRNGGWSRKPNFSTLYEDPRYSDEVYACLRQVVEQVMLQLFRIELTRINAPTVATAVIAGLGWLFKLRGGEYLIKALQALGKDHLVRNISYWGSSNKERKEVLTTIISGIYPLESDRADMLKQFSDEQLIELAFFAPQWLPLVQEALNWEGFLTAYYYFVAHTKEMGNDEKKAEIALYTSLDPEELADGAFDRKFFFEAYEAVGEKRFAMLYKAAKYLCDNSSHTRARKYADASLGLTGKETLLKEINEKRNKDALNAYCLLPLENDAELLERYQRVQLFIKESKQFGAQRQASEKRAAEIALLNLARVSRFEEITRLSWMMESDLLESNADCLEGIAVGDYIARIEIDTQGRNKLRFEKEGKALKSAPAKVKSLPEYLRLVEVHKAWTEQYRRARRMLETAMELQEQFGVEELEAIGNNPIISPMLSKLLIAQGDVIGHYQEGMITTLSGRVKPKKKEQVRIVHPYELYEKGIWRDWQGQIFAAGIVQPFKQVFRELYLKMDDELETRDSRRYSGYQIQVKQALAALKGRGWSADYESGLRKVFYKGDLVVTLFAEADWFSPGDVEAPSIDYVSFARRKSHEPITIGGVDPVIFSEVMRDIDMAVSIAFVGGVDPQTGFSTKQMRAAVVDCTAELLKLKNISVTDNFVNIAGTLANYSVHLATAIARQEGEGQMPILPVHSSHRGKLYLPFLDEDPKTAELVSKVILLAEDEKIKDPTILNLIKIK